MKQDLVPVLYFWLLLEMTLDYAALNRWQWKKMMIHKMLRKGAEWSACFITVCYLLCLVLLPSFQTIQILLFSLYHLSHTEVRMGMTQQGHCFVVLFYLFLDNEKSAEGLAWSLLPHIYTHETLPRPYGSSTGGYLTLLTLWHQKRRSWSLFFRGLSWIPTTMHHGWNRITFLRCLHWLDTLSSSLQMFFFPVIDRCLDCQKSSSCKNKFGNCFGEVTLWDLSCHNCPSSL